MPHLSKQPKSSRMRVSAKWASGAAAVDFAIIALPLFTVLLGIMVFGSAIYSYTFVCTAARDAVRYAVVHGSRSSSPATSTDITNVVLNEAEGLNTNNIAVSTTWSPNNNPGSVVSVQVSYTFQPMYPMLGSSLVVSSSSQMVISY